MRTVRLTCAACSAPLDVPEAVDQITCQYCGTPLEIQRDQAQTALVGEAKPARSSQQSESHLKPTAPITQQRYKDTRSATVSSKPGGLPGWITWPFRMMAAAVVGVFVLAAMVGKGIVWLVSKAGPLVLLVIAGLVGWFCAFIVLLLIGTIIDAAAQGVPYGSPTTGNISLILGLVGLFLVPIVEIFFGVRWFRSRKSQADHKAPTG